MNNYVAFPGLNLEFNIAPVAFNILGKNIYWYGIIIALGLFAGALVSMYTAKRNELKTDIITDIVIYGAPTAIIFARLYYCLFNFNSYINNPIEIFYLWEGGIAIYGAIIGAVISTFIYCKVKKLNVLKVFDVCILGVITGQFIGRWGNFVNKEAYGTITSLPWRMSIYENGQLKNVHPTFLYESLWNFIGLFVLYKINKNKKFNGLTFFSYLVWYGTGRAIIEGLRTDSLYLGPLRISQVVGIITAILGLTFIIIKAIKYNKTSVK
jgi:phosphatidylglycerol:prolipoprotein diacylglycerol transferase